VLVTGTAAQVRYAQAALGVPAARLRELPYPVAPLTVDAPETGPEILFLGRLEARKGPMTLIEALPALLARVPEARITLAGADTGGARSERVRLQQRADELGVRASVRFDPAWGPAAVREHLGRVRVVAVPSRWESFGYTAAEAMAAGRAVVASDIPAFRELIEDGVSGRIVRGDDWAGALAGLLEDPAGATALGAAARARIGARHLPADVAAATLAVYEQAAGG
jgi:glycosyltransferase involved in cell wall biosynthesis